MLIFPAIMFGKKNLDAHSSCTKEEPVCQNQYIFPIDTFRLWAYAKPTYLDEYIVVNYTIYTNEEGELILPENLGDLTRGSYYSTTVNSSNFKKCKSEHHFTFKYPKSGLYLLEPATWKRKSDNKIIKSEPVLIQVLPKYHPVEIADTNNIEQAVDESGGRLGLDLYKLHLKRWSDERRIICEYPDQIKAGIPFWIRYKLYYKKNIFTLYPIEIPDIPLKYIHNISNISSPREVSVEKDNFSITLWECELVYQNKSTYKIPNFSVICLYNNGLLRDTISQPSFSINAK